MTANSSVNFFRIIAHLAEKLTQIEGDEATDISYRSAARHDCNHDSRGESPGS